MKENTKIIATQSEMSNLVGMWAILLEKQDKELKAIIFINGKADRKHFICQIVSPLTGEPNVSVLMTINQLKRWVIIPNKELIDSIVSDFFNNKNYKYGIPFSLKQLEL